MKYLFILSLLFTSSLAAQSLILEENFQAKLERMDLEFVAPLDGDFKLRRSDTLRLIGIDQTFRSRPERLEVRIALLSPEELGSLVELPGMAARQLVMDLASNDETAPPISVHRFGDEELEYFLADWARQFTFKPKYRQLPFETAQLTALFRRGKGMAYLFLLFNRPPDTLDARQLMLHFKPLEEATDQR